MSRKSFVKVIFLLSVIFVFIFIQEAYAFEVAVINFKPKFGENKVNTKKLLELNKEAIKKGAKFIVNPELAISGGYCDIDIDEENIKQKIKLSAVTIPNSSVTQQFIRLAKRNKVYIVLGLAEIDESTKFIYNSAILVGPEGLIGKVRKKHWLIQLFNKSEISTYVFNTPIGKISILICADAYCPYMIEMIKGSSILAVPMWSHGGKSDSESLKETARYYRIYCIVSDSEKNNNSYVISPEGKIILRVSQDNSIGYIEIDCKEK